MRGARRADLRRTAGFVALPLFNGVAPLLLLPLITSRLGQEGWVAIAVAQSVGSAAAVIVELGWGLTGTQRIARQRPENRKDLVALALATRSIVWVPAAAASGAVAWFLVPTAPWAAVVIVVSAALSSICPTWAFIGAGRPSWILFADTVPRTLGLAVSAVALMAGGGIWWFALPTLAATVVSACVGHLCVGVRGRHLTRLRRRIVLGALRAQSRVLMGRAVSALYIALPVTLVSMVAAVEAVAVFAAIERIQRMLLTGLQAVPNAMQNWVGRAVTPALRRSRALRSIGISAGVGALAAVALVVFGSWASRVLFSGHADLPVLLLLASGSLVVLVSASRASGALALVAVQRVDGVAWSALCGAAIGVPAILVGAATAGALGGLVGEVVAEAIVLVIQLHIVFRELAKSRARRQEAQA